MSRGHLSREEKAQRLWERLPQDDKIDKKVLDHVEKRVTKLGPMKKHGDH